MKVTVRFIILFVHCLELDVNVRILSLMTSLKRFFFQILWILTKTTIYILDYAKRISRRNCSYIFYNDNIVANVKFHLFKNSLEFSRFPQFINQSLNGASNGSIYRPGLHRVKLAGLRASIGKTRCQNKFNASKIEINVILSTVNLSS